MSFNKTAPLTAERLRALFDYLDGALVSRSERGGRSGRRWPAGRNVGYLRADGYLEITIDGRHQKVHRLVWLWHKGSFPDGHIDHIDGNPANNRIENLRLASPAENQQNQRKPRSTNRLNVQGVHQVGNRFRAVVHKGYVKHHIGYFSSKEEAHQAYLYAKRQLHEFNTL